MRLLGILALAPLLLGCEDVAPGLTLSIDGQPVAYHPQDAVIELADGTVQLTTSDHDSIVSSNIILKPGARGGRCDDRARFIAKVKSDNGPVWWDGCSPLHRSLASEATVLVLDSGVVKVESSATTRDGALLRFHGRLRLDY